MGFLLHLALATWVLIYLPSSEAREVVILGCPSCRCLPDDTCWPSAQEWAHLNDTVGGKLIATVPLGAPCHDPTYNATECSLLQATWAFPQDQRVFVPRNSGKRALMNELVSVRPRRSWLRISKIATVTPLLQRRHPVRWAITLTTLSTSLVPKTLLQASGLARRITFDWLSRTQGMSTPPFPFSSTPVTGYHIEIHI